MLRNIRMLAARDLCSPFASFGKCWEQMFPVFHTFAFGFLQSKSLLLQTTMDKIEFRNVCPDIFGQRNDLGDSDIWRRESVVFERGRRYLIECASGTGKSSFCSYLLGMRNDFSGRILFDGRGSQTYSTGEWIELRKSGISLMFQELRLFPELTAYENVEIRNCLAHAKTKKVIAEWFERLGLGGRMDSQLGLMSFGQQQRVALVRALVSRFDFLLLDEPTSHLDDKNSDIMASLINEEAGSRGAGIIVTSIGRHMNMEYDHIFSL